MTVKEYQILEAQLSTYTVHWLPLQWAMRLIWEARAQGKISVDVIAWQLCEVCFSSKWKGKRDF